MAITNCPDCRAEISDAAGYCIFCGHPLIESRYAHDVVITRNHAKNDIARLKNINDLITATRKHYHSFAGGGSIRQLPCTVLRAVSRPVADIILEQLITYGCEVELIRNDDIEAAKRANLNS
jgi:hypothetical protein